jgi:hypothetical protein
MAELKSPVLTGMQDKELTYANGIPEHYPIPALGRQGCVLMRLEFTEDERRTIAVGHDLFVEVLTTGGIQPMRFTVGEKESVEDWKQEGY